MSERAIEFNNIIGRQDGGPEEAFHLKVTRHDHGQYALTISRKDPAGSKIALFHVGMTHAEVQAIADLSEAPQVPE
jgi:hypothetical protein